MFGVEGVIFGFQIGVKRVFFFDGISAHIRGLGPSIKFVLKSQTRSRLDPLLFRVLDADVR